MKLISNFTSIFLIAVFMTFYPTLSGAEEEIPPFGFVRIVNCVSHGEGNTKFSIDREDIYPAGYELGQDCGGFSIQRGTHSVSVSKTGVIKGTTKIEIGTGETITMIAFSELVPPVNSDDPPTWTVKLLLLKQRTVEKGYGLTLVSVAASPELQVSLGIRGDKTTENHTLIRLKISDVSLGGNRGEVSIKVGNKHLTTVSPDTPGNYVVVLYENEKGEPTALYFFDPKFTIAG